MYAAGKPSIVEQLNEFIQELKDIDTSIAAHVSSRPPFLCGFCMLCRAPSFLCLAAL